MSDFERSHFTYAVLECSAKCWMRPRVTWTRMCAVEIDARAGCAADYAERVTW